MTNYHKIDYVKVKLPEELLISFAKALVPEIRKFYQSDEGKAYFENWLKRHPEYAASVESGASAQSTVKGG